MNKLHWAWLEHENWKLCIAATDKGLCYVGSPGEDLPELEKQLHKRFPSAELVEDRDAVKTYLDELKEYLEGTRKEFSQPMDVKGTPFQEEIWQALKAIPYGETYSYSDIARHINRPSAVRAVGTAIGANPVLITVPCHRVIGKSGAITGYRGGIEMKQHLLQLERQD